LNLNKNSNGKHATGGVEERNLGLQRPVENGRKETERGKGRTPNKKAPQHDRDLLPATGKGKRHTGDVRRT